MYWSHLSTPPCNWFCPHGDRCNAWAKGQKASSRVQSLAWLESLILLMPRPQYTVDYLKMEVWRWKRIECFRPKYAEGIRKHNNHRSFSICVWRNWSTWLSWSNRLRKAPFSWRISVDSSTFVRYRWLSSTFVRYRWLTATHVHSYRLWACSNISCGSWRVFSRFTHTRLELQKNKMSRNSPWWELQGDCSFCRCLAQALREVPLSN